MDAAFLADLVLITHALYVLFIAGGFALVLFGAFLGWSWVRNFWFRSTHLAAITGVAILSWLQKICPLTTLETYYRSKAGQTTYQETFVAHWLHQILFYEAPAWIFSVAYTLFVLAVIISWIYISPEIPWKRASGRD